MRKLRHRGVQEWQSQRPSIHTCGSQNCVQNLDILLLRSLLSFSSTPRPSGRGQRHGRINAELQNTGMFTPRVDREFQIPVPNLLQVCSLVQSGDSSYALPSHPNLSGVLKAGCEQGSRSLGSPSYKPPPTPSQNPHPSVGNTEE